MYTLTHTHINVYMYEQSQMWLPSKQASRMLLCCANLRVSVYFFTYIHIHSYLYTNIHIYIYICSYICAHIHTHMYACIHMHTRVHTPTQIYGHSQMWQRVVAHHTQMW